jgi:hypothetical protein
MYQGRAGGNKERYPYIRVDIWGLGEEFLGGGQEGPIYLGKYMGFGNRNPPFNSNQMGSRRGVPMSSRRGANAPISTDCVFSSRYPKLESVGQRFFPS